MKEKKVNGLLTANEMQILHNIYLAKGSRIGYQAIIKGCNINPSYRHVYERLRGLINKNMLCHMGRRYYILTALGHAMVKTIREDRIAVPE